MSWADYEQKDAQLRAAGWTVEYPDEYTRIKRPPTGYGAPINVPYKAGLWADAYRRATWAAAGVSVWVPVVDPEELAVALEYLGGQGGA